MKSELFESLVQRFFAEYLQTQRGLSSNTIAAYRDTFKLLLTFLAQHYRIRVDQITLKHLCSDSVLGFLEYLERSRRNTPCTRNLRMAAIRTFVRFVTALYPVSGFLTNGQRILAIPTKRTPTRRVGYLQRNEVDALLASTDDATWSGRRDHVLFLLLYNTGARVSEALQVCGKDIRDKSVMLQGKGRKERVVPLWNETNRLLRRWSDSNGIAPDQPLFMNRWGSRLSRDGAALRLATTVKKAADKCPSLAQRTVTPHTLRHTCAMHLLQSGIALEIIALWLGHEKPITTHLYIEADLKMKEECLSLLQHPPATKARRSDRQGSRLLAFLEAI
jgi:integrase/recombinase XerD